VSTVPPVAAPSKTVDASDQLTDTGHGDRLSAATGDGRSVALIQLLGEVDHRGASRVRLHNTAYIEDTAWAHRQITQAA
jgi:hypothetical protein